MDGFRDYLLKIKWEFILFVVCLFLSAKITQRYILIVKKTLHWTHALVNTYTVTHQ